MVWADSRQAAPSCTVLKVTTDLFHPLLVTLVLFTTVWEARRRNFWKAIFSRGRDFVLRQNRTDGIRAKASDQRSPQRCPSSPQPRQPCPAPHPPQPQHCSHGKQRRWQRPCALCLRLSLSLSPLLSAVSRGSPQPGRAADLYRCGYKLPLPWTWLRGEVGGGGERRWYSLVSFLIFLPFLRRSVFCVSFQKCSVWLAACHRSVTT